ncbi:MAG: NAD-dependent epimerase/dehydratase family protein [Mastigocoleus sp.]|mgnify:CR=1 FL=1
MNLAIIGCGYVGRAVAQYWHHKVVFIVSVTTTTAEKVPLLQTVSQKVTVLNTEDTQALKSFLQNQDVVLVSVARKGKSSYEDTYLGTACNLVSVITETSVRQVIYTSTCSVYGNLNGALVTEETPVNAVSDAEKVLKRTEETWLGASSDKLRVCILRLGGIYGNGRELVKIYSRLAGKTRPGDGSRPINWIHLEDIVGAIEFVREHQLRGIYNLVDDSQFTNKELIQNVCEKYNLDPVSWDPSVQSDRSSVKLSNQKIKNAGYKLIHPQIIF